MTSKKSISSFHFKVFFFQHLLKRTLYFDRINPQRTQTLAKINLYALIFLIFASTLHGQLGTLWLLGWHSLECPT